MNTHLCSANRFGNNIKNEGARDRYEDTICFLLFALEEKKKYFLMYICQTTPMLCESECVCVCLCVCVC